MYLSDRSIFLACPSCVLRINKLKAGGWCFHSQHSNCLQSADTTRVLSTTVIFIEIVENNTKYVQLPKIYIYMQRTTLDGDVGRFSHFIGVFYAVLSGVRLHTLFCGKQKYICCYHLEKRKHKNKILFAKYAVHFRESFWFSVTGEHFTLSLKINYKHPKLLYCFCR